MFQNILFKNLFHNNKYAKKYINYLRVQQFNEISEKYILDIYSKYYSKYGEIPNYSQIKVELTKNKDIRQEQLNETIEYLDKLKNTPNEKHTSKWLKDETETWIKDQELQIAIVKSAELIQNKENKEQIPELIRNAFKITFDEDLGVDILNEKTWEPRHQRYNKKNQKFMTSFEKFNICTAGGFEPKTLNIFMAGTNVGKTTLLVAFASDFVRKGYNVLYITLEMSQDKITQRIESNLFDLPTNDIKELETVNYISRLQKIKSKNYGRIMVKEYPTGIANTNHFRRYLDDIELKTDFKPDIVMVDYISLMSSCRIKNDSLYSYNKAIVEELRGLAVEKELCIFSAIQTNRSGFNSSDASLSDTAESWGVPATADFQAALISTEELEKQNKMIIKILKNRYSGIKNFKFYLETNMELAKFYEINSKGQEQEKMMTNNQEAVRKFKDMQSRNRVKQLSMKFE